MKVCKCDGCDNEFDPTRPHQVFCSTICKNRYGKINYKKIDGKEVVCKNPLCQNILKLRCTTHLFCCKKCRIDYYLDKNKDEVNMCYKTRAGDRTDIRKRMISQAKRNAKKRGRELDIIYTDLTIPETCPILGIDMTPTASYGDGLCSVDRIDSNKGYIKGNVQVISYRANVLKNNGSLEEFKKLVKWMEENK